MSDQPLASEERFYPTATRLGSSVALVGLGVITLLGWLLVSALTICLNESPRYAAVAQGALSGSWLASRWLLGLFGGLDTACQPSALARALGLIGLVYLASLAVLDGGRVPRRLALALVLTVTGASHVVLLASPALLSTDILDYASYGRVAAVHASNPYVVPPAAFAGDAFAGYGAWQGVVTVYGPLWTAVDAAIARALPAGDAVQLVLVYKGLAELAVLASLGALWWLLGRWTGPAQRPLALTVFAWNPLVLVELVANGHNDALMLLLVLLGMVPLTVLAAPEGLRDDEQARPGRQTGDRVSSGFRPVAGGTRLWAAALVCLTLGALVKFVPAAVGAAVALVWLRRRPGGRATVLVAGVLLSVVLVVSVPWLSSTDVLRPLLGIVSGGQRFKDGWQDAPAAWIAVRILPTLGVPAEPATLRESVARAIAWAVTRGVFVACIALEVRFLWRQARSEMPVAVRAVVTSSARALLLAVLLFVTQVYPWYYLWPLPLVTLLGWRSILAKASVALTVTFLPAYYLREFQSYGVFYVPLYVAAALVLVVVLNYGASAWRAVARQPVRPATLASADPLVERS
ncbi:MAG TPA: hypothetical protein VFA49_02935 [Chloroflexota bacterium]|nr:hypothetical protein [Chloroflexota bacterium]